MKFAAIDDHREQFPIATMCQALKVSLAGYHSWRKRPMSERRKDECRLIQLIEKIHIGSKGTYGSPRIHAMLSGMEESDCSLSRIARLMRKLGISAKTKKKFKATTNSRHNLPVVLITS